MTYVAASTEGQSKVALVIGKVKEKGLLNTLARGARYAVYKTNSKFSDYYRTNFSVPKMAARAIADVKASGKRGLFLDCGSNLGQGFEFFRKHFPKEYFDYELFEPNPNCLPRLEKVRDQLTDHKITIHNAAVSTQDGSLNFYGLAEDEGGEYSQGGSVLKEHNSSFYAPKEEASLSVRAIDFPALIADRSKGHAVIVIKMDIEGGEYDVLEGLIDRGMVDPIHSIFCEFHSQYMEPEGRTLFRERERRIQQAVRRTDCAFFLWR